MKQYSGISKTYFVDIENADSWINIEDIFKNNFKRLSIGTYLVMYQKKRESVLSQHTAWELTCFLNTVRKLLQNLLNLNLLQIKKSHIESLFESNLEVIQPVTNSNELRCNRLVQQVDFTPLQVLDLSPQLLAELAKNALQRKLEIVVDKYSHIDTVMSRAQSKTLYNDLFKRLSAAHCVSDLAA